MDQNGVPLLDAIRNLQCGQQSVTLKGRVKSRTDLTRSRGKDWLAIILEDTSRVDFNDTIRRVAFDDAARRVDRLLVVGQEVVVVLSGGRVEPRNETYPSAASSRLEVILTSSSELKPLRSMADLNIAMAEANLVVAQREQALAEAKAAQAAVRWERQIAGGAPRVQQPYPPTP